MESNVTTPVVVPASDLRAEAIRRLEKKR